MQTFVSVERLALRPPVFERFPQDLRENTYFYRLSKLWIQAQLSVSAHPMHRNMGFAIL